jgi:hypothetical protein
LPGFTIRSATDEDIDSVLSLWKDAGGPRGATDSRESLLGLLATDG